MLFLYVFLIIVAVVLIVPLFISKELNYEKSILIDAPSTKVWENVSTLAAMDKWSPWNERDPHMERSLTGVDGSVGATQHWKSDAKNVGEGRQTIVALDPPEQLKTKLEFLKPFKSQADAYIKLDEGNEGTITTWGFESQMPYPMNMMKLFMNFEKNMDKDFGSGLQKLKAICEQKKH
ncbi:MAG: SRPBCC family protein [Cyclobacteriaceae bacterium]|nr:SRPBCC family protein [Cyclobacteriaceae bacterium]